MKKLFIALMLIVSLSFAQTIKSDDVFLTIDKKETWLSGGYAEFTIKNPTTQNILIKPSTFNIGVRYNNTVMKGIKIFTEEKGEWVEFKGSKSLRSGQKYKVRLEASWELKQSISLDWFPNIKINSDWITHYKWDWFNATCGFKRNVTFQNSWNSEDLYGFPFVLVLNDSNFNYNASTAADNLQIYDSDGTLLGRQAEKWNTSGNSYVWTRVPQIDSASNTDFIEYYYGCSSNSTNSIPIWDANYSVVYQMNETSGSTFFDASSNLNNATVTSGSPTQYFNGQIDGSWNFTNTPYADSMNNVGLTGDTDRTLSIWINAYANANFPHHVGFGTGGSNSFFIGVGGFNTYFLRNDVDVLHSGVDPIIDLGKWTLLTATYNGSVEILYWYNASLGSMQSIGNNSPALNTGASSFRFGDFLTPGNPAQAAYDQITLTTNVRSLKWLNATYLAGTNSFGVYGAELEEPTTNYTISSPIYQHEFQITQINITLREADTSTINYVTIYWDGTPANATPINSSGFGVNITAPFVVINNTEFQFYFNYSVNSTVFITDNVTQNITWGSFISSISADPVIILEGSSFVTRANVTLLNASASRNVDVMFNSINSTMDISSSNSSLVQFIATLTAPLIIPDNTTITLNHTLVTTFNSTTSYRQFPNPVTVTIFKIVLTNCSDQTLSVTPILNYTTYDEISSLRLENINYSWRGVIQGGTGEARNYSFLFPNFSHASICIYPLTENARLNSSLVFDDLPTSTINYAQRTHFMDSIIVNGTSARNISSYLASELNVSNILFKVQDAFLQPVANVIITIQRWNYTLNNYVEVESIKTDVNGETLTPLIPNNQLYKFAVFRENVKLREFPDQVISTSTIVLPTATSIPILINRINAIDYTCNWFNDTKIVFCNYTSNDININKFRLIVLETRLIGGRTFCDVNNTQASGSLTCDLSSVINESDSFIAYFDVFRIDSPETEYTLWGIVIPGQGTSSLMGAMGLFLFWGLLLTIPFAIGITPSLYMVGIVVAVMFGSVLGFIGIEDSVITIIVVLAAIIIHRVKR